MLAEGRVHVAGVPEQERDASAQVARAAVRSRALAEAGGPGLSACAFFYPDTVTWAFGVQGVVARGGRRGLRASGCSSCAAMHDCGRPINPMIVEGQLHGGIAQGLGSALGEELIYDDAGQLLTGTLMDYPMPRADEMPPLEVIHIDFPSAINAARHQGRGRERRHLPRRRDGQRGRGRARRLRHRDRPSPRHRRARVRAAARHRALARAAMNPLTPALSPEGRG